MDIIIGSDHAGFTLKEECKKLLADELGYDVKDVGVYDTRSSDYPDIAKEVAGAVSGGDFEKGILICGSGIGMSIAANRFRGVNAALCHNLYTADMCRKHNDANILVFGARVIGEGLALEMVKIFLTTEFEGGRHQMRINKIDD